MIKPTLIITAVLSVFVTSNVTAAECKPYKKAANMYQIVDDQGKVFFLGSPNHPACSDLISKRMGTERKPIERPQAPAQPESKSKRQH
ncbi:hypothetical protein [Methylomagnum sp.]